MLGFIILLLVVPHPSLQVGARTLHPAFGWLLTLPYRFEPGFHILLLATHLSFRVSARIHIRLQASTTSIQVGASRTLHPAYGWLPALPYS
jgi:hypothetical protein